MKVLYSRLTIHMFWGDADFDYTSVLERIKGINQNKTPEWAHSLRHIATYEWLHTKSASNALEIIDSGLKVLEETRWRIIYDFYFEKAEWMRIQNENENKSIHPLRIYWVTTKRHWNLPTKTVISTWLVVPGWVEY